MIDELRERLGEVSDLERAAMLLAWDQEVNMPAAGAQARAEQRATISRVAHERFCDDHVGALLEAAEPRDELESDLVAVTRRDYERARRVPTDLVADLSRAAADGHGAWSRARAGAGFEHFAPALQRNIELARRLSACFEPGEHLYDALLEEYEPGMRTAEVRAMLAQLRDGLRPLVDAAADVDDRVLREGPSDEAGQRRLVATVLEAVGVDGDAWRLDIAEHPFQATLAISDIRLTTRFDQDGIEGLFGALHEFGHGLYERQVDPALARTPLATGASSAWHESQSRLWENMVGRSPAFWQWCLPHAAQALPARFGAATWQQVAHAAAAIRPSLVRISADEVTYGLHIALRFELELALLEGTLAVADLPAAWNEKVRAYLGVDVPDDLRGVLQDVHWSEGLFGYFPTYALGNVIAGQVWARLRDDVAALDEHIARGDFAPLCAWLGEHVHRFGRRRMPSELVEQVCGGPLDPGPYLAYLRERAGASAALMP
ncbi:MAG: carboxypeptidase M32 [Solirubrobacteraceae bacterium]